MQPKHCYNGLKITELLINNTNESFQIKKSEIKKFHNKKLNERINCTVCSDHVTYAFQSESTLYSCLNVKELLAGSRREI